MRLSVYTYQPSVINTFRTWSNNWASNSSNATAGASTWAQRASLPPLVQDLLPPDDGWKKQP